jgi:hypothetical protein
MHSNFVPYQRVTHRTAACNGKYSKIGAYFVIIIDRDGTIVGYHEQNKALVVETISTHALQ